MSFTVAPLTTTVMGSVGDHFSGTASGVNNAMTRISGVFANAILGALAVLLFSGALQEKIRGMELTPAAQQAVVAEAVNLGNARVPAGIAPDKKERVREIEHAGFIGSYSEIMRISAGLAWLGALMAFFFIRNKP